METWFISFPRFQAERRQKMVRKFLGLLVVLGFVGTNVAMAKMPFLPAKKIKAEEWKTELQWSADVVSKIILAQTDYENKAKLNKEKIKEEDSEFVALLNSREPSKIEIESYVKNRIELEKNKLENDIEFILQIKSVLNPEQQKQLLEKMSEKKKRTKKSKTGDSE